MTESFRSSKGGNALLSLSWGLRIQGRLGKADATNAKLHLASVASKCSNSYLHEGQVGSLPQTQHLRIPLVLGLVFSLLLYLTVLSSGMISISIHVWGGVIVRQAVASFLNNFQSTVGWALQGNITCCGIFGNLLNVSVLIPVTCIWEN